MPKKTLEQLIAEREELDKQIAEHKKEVSEAFVKELRPVVNALMKGKSSWSEFKQSVHEYQPDNDKTAKALGFTHKNHEKGENKYYLRQVRGASKI